MALLSAYTVTRRNERRIGQALQISLPTISSLSATTPTTNTVGVAGVKTNDVVVVTVQTPTNGVMVDGYVSSAGTVTIRQNNVTGSTVTTVTATVAQFQVLRR